MAIKQSIAFLNQREYCHYYLVLGEEVQMENALEWLMADLTGLAVQIFFFITIIFMVVDPQKPPVKTSVPTGIALIIFGIGGSITAPAVALATAFNGVLWLTLGLQRYRQNTQPTARGKAHE